MKQLNNTPAAQGQHYKRLSSRLILVLFFLLPLMGWGQTRTSITTKAELEAILANPTSAGGSYIIEADFSAFGYNPTNWDSQAFTGTLTSGVKSDGTFYTISNLDKPLFKTATDATISNIMLKGVGISQSGLVGAIACTANGSTKIYNCGILPTTTLYDSEGNITGFDGSSVASTSEHCGSLVGKLDVTARVINCFSYANVSAPTGNSKIAAGLVGNNNTSSNQNSLNTIVVNCMFYGEIPEGNIKRPVYGNKMITNNSSTGINPYDYYRAGVSFDNYDNIDKYNRSWPADVEYLTRFEYYRSILNSNRQLCTYWVTDHAGTAQTAADTALIAKWVLDPSIAPLPILKKWGKYPSIINPDPEKVWDPAANSGQGGWIQRINAKPFQGRILTEMGCPGHPGMLKVTVKAGSHNSGATDKTLYLPITDMDTLHHDYGYAKVQLPYYNEQFGNVNSTVHTTRYGNNYTDQVVTGWKIIDCGTDGTITDYHSFSTEGDTPYNYADRHCKDKDLFGTTGRVFAQGGYYYVPEGVNEITIEAKWGKAVYLRNKGHYIDRVNITNSSGNYTTGSAFSPAGTLPTTPWFTGQVIKDDWRDAVKALDKAEFNDAGVLDTTVYDQAIVLIGNLQLRNENAAVGYNIDSKWHPYTIMSMDQNLDNEPDYCFEFQFRKGYNRDGIQPIRFDFLPVPELGMAVRYNKAMNTIGIFVPQGHFEITETSFMHTTQFEYDGNKSNALSNNGGKVPAPIILNGGHFEQIVVRYTPYNNTQCFIMGGHFRMLRFTPGAHANNDANSTVMKLCPVNCIGGEYPEFYLSGIYNHNVNPTLPVQGHPKCYTNGGRFNLMAGAGYEKVMGNVTFKIDHSFIKEFYGGGINGSKPVEGNIDVTIDHSLVRKYCGGPQVGDMTGKTVTTRATGTTFGYYYGGGNGGTSYYREKKQDGNTTLPASTAAGWASKGYQVFNPLNTKTSGSDTPVAYEGPSTTLKRGYHALFEFECFVESNGINTNDPTIRAYIHWAQFGTTITGNVSNTLTDCIVKHNYYGGGNMGNVNGTVNTTLGGNTIIEGDAYGAGYSGNIEPFRIHDKDATVFPYETKDGTIDNGELFYLKNSNDTDRYYTWCNKNSSGEVVIDGVAIPTSEVDGSTVTTDTPTFEYPVGSNKWYVLTEKSLEGLGEVTGKSTIILQGNTIVQGSVFGGGNESAVNNDTEVRVLDHTKVHGNIYGGGNEGVVGGNTKVIVNGK